MVFWNLNFCNFFVAYFFVYLGKNLEDQFWEVKTVKARAHTCPMIFGVIYPIWQKLRDEELNNELPYTIEEIFSKFQNELGVDLEELLKENRKVSLRLRRDGKKALFYYINIYIYYIIRYTIY